ncbi:hypothetical protein KP509_11G021400 [Ceratopteris richardii]|uniref:Uncharacterized protein n=1 Tax=Ceratopteris richardii TaxID=49495 RepID=A0A8T2TPQ0_CERRI|nr:hypothetical protein KP509_11G021400 [Ceratopteris richardii]
MDRVEPSSVLLFLFLRDLETTMEDMETDSQAFLKVMEASFASLLPLVLKVAIQLGLVNILETAEREQDGGDSSLTAMEIAAQVQGRTASVEQTASLLNRILRILANHGLLNATSSRSGGIRYGLNQSSRVLVQPDSLDCISRFLLLLEDPDALRSYSNAHDALLHGGIPFVMAHGMPLYTFMQQNQMFKQLFHGTMSAHSRLIMGKVLDTYEGLQTVHSLVDVGGGNGDCLSMITSRYTHIRGINLDLAYIIADAPSYTGKANY